MAGLNATAIDVVDMTGDDEENPEDTEDTVLRWWRVGPPPVIDDLKPETERLFESLAVVKDAIKYLSVKHSFPYGVVQSNSSRYEVSCKGARGNNKENVICTFHIKCRPQERLGGKVMVIKSNLVHSCGCMFTARRHNKRGLGAQFASSQSEHLIVDCPKATPRNLQDFVKRTTGTDLHYRTAHRAKKLCSDRLMHNEVMGFQYIGPYFRKVEAKMPGSVAVMERDEDNRLLRTFVMLQPMIESFKYGLPVLSLDACHLRNQFKGCLMAATMMDSLHQIHLLAWGTCPVENGEHWDWFLRHVRYHMPQRDIGYGDDTSSQRIITIFSDREKGIARALTAHFPTSYHVFCYFHILKNVKVLNPSLKEETRRLMLAACRAQRPSTFDRLMSTIQMTDPKVYGYLTNIPLEKWATAYCPYPARKFGIITSNASESMNNWMNDERNVLHLQIHASLISKVMERQAERRKINSKYVRSSPIATFPEETQALLVKRMDRGSRLRVKSAGDKKFLVGGKWEVVLDRDRPLCSCNLHHHIGLPCEHMAAAIQSIDGNMESELEGRGLMNIADFADSVYSQQNMSSFYAAVVEPCALDVSDLRPDGITLPCAERAQAGRPKMTRFQGATDPAKESRCTCTTCGKKGHNKAGCKNWHKRQEKEAQNQSLSA